MVENDGAAVGVRTASFVIYYCVRGGANIARDQLDFSSGLYIYYMVVFGN